MGEDRGELTSPEVSEKEAKEAARELSRVSHNLVRRVGRAVGDFDMIVEGDRILVALSGGKDSWVLLHALHELKRRSPVFFTLDAVTVHPGYPEFDPSPITAFCEARGWSHRVVPSNMFEIIEAKREPGSSYCSICSRLRRGILYSLAREGAYDKIALGHHADDLIETFLMSAFFTGEIKSMPPVLKAEDGDNTVIRPMCYAFESEVVNLATLLGFPLISCGCVVSGCVHSQRHRVKALLSKLEAEHPGIKANVLSALGRVRQEFLINKPFRGVK